MFAQHWNRTPYKEPEPPVDSKVQDMPESSSQSKRERDKTLQGIGAPVVIPPTSSVAQEPATLTPEALLTTPKLPVAAPVAAPRQQRRRWPLGLAAAAAVAGAVAVVKLAGASHVVAPVASPRVVSAPSRPTSAPETTHGAASTLGSAAAATAPQAGLFAPNAVVGTAAIPTEATVSPTAPAEPTETTVAASAPRKSKVSASTRGTSTRRATAKATKPSRSPAKVRTKLSPARATTAAPPRATRKVVAKRSRAAKARAPEGTTWALESGVVEASPGENLGSAEGVAEPTTATETPAQGAPATDSPAPP